MSTNSVIGYFDKVGTFRGTRIIYDGMTVGAEAEALLRSKGKRWLIKWIEAGIAGSGYRSMEADAEPMTGGVPGTPVTLGEYFDSYGLEYCYVLTESAHGRVDVVPIESHLYEEKRRDLGFWKVWTQAEKEVGRKREDINITAGRIARETFGNDQPVLNFILTRLIALMER